jgi:quercetin dioxygenase-like cupin family protein
MSEEAKSGLIKPIDMKYVPKRWGWELWICNNEKYCGKKLFIKQGHHLSYHKHEVKDEVLFCESGRIIFTHNLNEEVESIEMTPGYAFHVPPGVTHQMQALEDTMLIEFSTQHLDEDSYRTTTDLVLGKKVNLQDA